MTIFICGDSTAASYAPERAPITGWGQLLGEYLPGVKVDNRAMAGRSSKSFLAEGRLTEIEKVIQPGDLLLIQFTHNDTSSLVWRHTDANTSFPNTLSVYVDTARIHGAQPVLLTPIPGRSWQGDTLQETHGAYPDAIRRLAFMKNVPLIDVYSMGTAHLRQLGEEASRRLFMHVESGVFPDYPNGKTDDVHTRAPGADFFARSIASALRDMQLVKEI